MSHALSPQPGRSRWLRRLVLQGITVVILGWVSYGSHEVLTWIGMPWWPAWLYPAIVDLAVLYVTPFAVDTELPDHVRKHAKVTRRMILPVVTFFNIFHMILFVQQHQPSVPEPGLAVMTEVLAYVIAVITGCIPVAAYARVTTLETMDKAHEVSLGIEAQRSATQRAEQRRLDDEEFTRQQQAEQAAHDRKLEELRAGAEVEERARVSRRESLGDSQRASRVTPAAAKRESASVKDVNPLVEKLLREEPKLEDLVAGLAPGKKGEQVTALLRDAWNAGIDLSGTNAARLVGCDRTYGTKAVAALRAQGFTPASERLHLAAVGNN